MKKTPFFYQNHLENMQKCDYLKWFIFMGLKRFLSVEKIPKQNFKVIFAPKHKMKKKVFYLFDVFRV